MDFIGKKSTVVNDKHFVFDNLELTFNPDEGNDEEGKSVELTFVTLEDNSPNDNKVSLLGRILRRTPLKGESMASLQNGSFTLNMEDLKGYQNDRKKAMYRIAQQKPSHTEQKWYHIWDDETIIENTDVSVYNGEWFMEFDANFEPFMPRTQKAPEQMLIYGYEISMEDFKITPITASFRVNSNYIVAMEEDGVDFKEWLQFTIHYTDGTSEKIVEDTGGTINPGGSGGYPNGEIAGITQFSQVIDVKNIEYISYFGQKIYLSK